MYVENYFKNLPVVCDKLRCIHHGTIIKTLFILIYIQNCSIKV